MQSPLIKPMKCQVQTVTVLPNIQLRCSKATVSFWDQFKTPLARGVRNRVPKSLATFTNVGPGFLKFTSNS